MIKTLAELDDADDYGGMIQGRVAMLNVETNRKEYVYVVLSLTSCLSSRNNHMYHREGMLCNQETVTSRATFTGNNPLLVIVDILSPNREDERGRCIANDIRLHQIKRTLRIGDEKYVRELLTQDLQ